MLLRKSMLEANYARQVQVEKDAIRSNIGRMQPGVQKTYLKLRLDKLNNM